jgi:hypothetical protein
VPADGRDGISAVWGWSRELVVTQLVDRGFPERLVAKVFGANRINEVGHGDRELEVD